jgi:Ca2+-binding RTX toxin-like protein
MYGGSEGDALYGFCDDTVEGDGANDNVYGDSLGNEPGAADSLWGEDGDDEKYWGRCRRDFLDGGAGKDVIPGEEGHDTIQVRDGEQDTAIDCGAVFSTSGWGPSPTASYRPSSVAARDSSRGVAADGRLDAGF